MPRLILSVQLPCGGNWEGSGLISMALVGHTAMHLPQATHPPFGTTLLSRTSMAWNEHSFTQRLHRTQVL
jgi:hypothetical protein